MSIEAVMPSNHLILCRPLLLPSVFPSIRIFSNESVLHIRWPKYWSFSLSISPSNEYSGLISFRIDWLGLLAAQGTLKKSLGIHNIDEFTLPQVWSFPLSGLEAESVSITRIILSLRDCHTLTKFFETEE